jgi:hypothetical protein
MLNSDGEQIDLLTQELEQVDNIEPTGTTGSGNVGSDSAIAGAGAGGISNDRASFTQTFASDGGINGTENEKLLAQHQGMSNFTNSGKLLNESPATSGRNTPTSIAMQKRSTNRSETTTPPPSLTGGSSSSKHRSLT